MLEKLKKMPLWGKSLIGLVLIGATVLAGMFFGGLFGNGEAGANDTVLNSKLENLIEADYKIEGDIVVKEGNADINIISDMNNENVKELTKKMSIVLKDTNAQKATINVFTDKVITDFDFYTEGLNTVVEIDLTKKAANIAEFVKTPKMEASKPETLKEVKDEILKKEGNIAKVSLSMNVEELSEAEILANAISYQKQLRTLNKDLTGVEIKINPNADKNYESNSEFDTVIKANEKLVLD